METVGKSGELEGAATLTPKQRAELFERTPGEIDDDQCYAQDNPMFYHRWRFSSLARVLFHISGTCSFCGVSRVFRLVSPEGDSE